MNSENGQQRAFDLERDDLGRLVLIDGHGQRHVGVEAVRGFPISEPDRWISICDGEGREVALVGDLADLPAKVRELLEDDLAQREFVPLIRRILSVPPDTEPASWDVETDRGRTRFVVKIHDDVRRLGPQRAMIVDSQGIRYLVDRLDQLDPASYRILERYL
jgi:hypothetical protein